jgi:hypothetical protein
MFFLISSEPVVVAVNELNGMNLNEEKETVLGKLR